MAISVRIRCDDRIALVDRDAPSRLDLVAETSEEHRLAAASGEIYALQVSAFTVPKPCPVFVQLKIEVRLSRSPISEGSHRDMHTRCRAVHEFRYDHLSPIRRAGELRIVGRKSQKVHIADVVQLPHQGTIARSAYRYPDLPIPHSNVVAAMGHAEASSRGSVFPPPRSVRFQIHDFDTVGRSIIKHGLPIRSHC